MWLGAAAGVLAACLLLYFFNPEQVPIYPQCPFRKWTGLDCPGCGGLRAMHQLLHGNVMAALRLNAFVVLLIPVAAGFAVKLAWHRWRGISRPAANGIGWWIFGASLAVFSLWRNLI